MFYIIYHSNKKIVFKKELCGKGERNQKSSERFAFSKSVLEKKTW